MLRVAIVDADKCKPSKCNLECKKYCPVNKTGKQCITGEQKDKVITISEQLCIGSVCGLCVKKCPFDAITIINLPSELENQLVHRYGTNGFCLYRLPLPKVGSVIGILGNNGCGKTTILKILSNKQVPSNFSGMEMPITTRKYFEGIGKITTSYKPQHVDLISRALKGKVSDFFTKNKVDISQYQKEDQLLSISCLLDKEVANLSGGELQRFSIFVVSIKDADFYIYDEPSSFLDIKQRINMATLLQQKGQSIHILVVDHDLSVMDMVSDYIHILYGQSAKYGIASTVMNTNNGINTFLDGYISAENMRFREEPLSFRINKEDVEDEQEEKVFKYPDMTQTYDTFSLQVKGSSFKNNEITVLLGENGIGKTTFIKLLAQHLKESNQLCCAPDGKSVERNMTISYKPQMIAPKFQGTVSELLYSKIKDAMMHSQFTLDVIKPLEIQKLFDRPLSELSGGELQVVGIALCLGTNADVYLLDEPSAYLDCNKRVTVAKIVRKFIKNTGKSCFVVEHDLLMILYFADKILFFEGIPSKQGTVTESLGVTEGLNKFLKSVNVTMRRDHESGRPRFNKLDSVKDKKQKQEGQYIFLD